MKKILALALALVLALSLTACGGKNDPEPSGSGGTGSAHSTSGESEQEHPDNSEADPQEDGKTSTDGKDQPDEGSLAAYLADFDMTEDDLKVEGITELTLLDNGDIAIGTDGNPSLELIQAWYEKVYESCRARSDDGKVYTQETWDFQGNVAEQTEFLLEEQVDFSQDFSGGWGTANTETWVYPDGGGTVWVVARWESATAGETLTFLIERY